MYMKWIAIEHSEHTISVHRNGMERHLFMEFTSNNERQANKQSHRQTNIVYYLIFHPQLLQHLNRVVQISIALYQPTARYIACTHTERHNEINISRCYLYRNQCEADT